jgi:hypothetical protein
VAFGTSNGDPSFTSLLDTHTVTRAFTVSAAGTYTYYVNGIKSAGGLSDVLWYGSSHAMYFHP